MVRRGLLGCLVVLSAALPVPAEGPANEELMKVVAELKATVARQEKRIAELEAARASATAAAGKGELAAAAREMSADAAKRPALPTWLDNLRFYGDLRLRYQSECYSGEDRSDDKPRNRLRFRLRFGVLKTWLDGQLETGFRLASGETNDPTTTNQTFTDNFTEKPVWIDQAFVRYLPKWMPGLVAVGGKMANPLIHTEITWDSDVSPEGLWVQYRHKFGPVEPFANVGFFFLNENYKSPAGVSKDSTGQAVDYTLRDSTLWSYQLGLVWTIVPDVKWTFAMTYYDFDHLDTGFRTAGGNHQVKVIYGPGSGDYYYRLGAGQFRVINMTNSVAWTMCGLPMRAFFDILRNCGNADSGAYADQDTAYNVGLKIGTNRRKGDWAVGYRYAYIEANSWSGELNESDFGSSNRKGHVWQAGYNITDWLLLMATVYWTEPITGPARDQRDVSTRIDLIWSF